MTQTRPAPDELRVVHLIGSMPSIGGAERLVLDLASCSRGAPVPVITWWRADNSLIDKTAETFVNLIPLRPFSIENLRRARFALRQADILHVHLFPSLWVAPMLSLWAPLIYTEHNTWNRRRSLASLRLLERMIYRKYEKIVAISDDTGKALTTWLGFEPPRLETIPNGVQLTRFPLQSRAALRNPVVIGMAARMTAARDHRTLLVTLSKLTRNFRLRLAGDGPLLPQLKGTAAELGITDRVDFLGRESNMPGFMASLDIYVQSSCYDGFSLGAVEAMASGLPTIGSDVPGLRDTIGNRDLLFSVGDADHLASMIRTIADTPGLFGELSKFAVSRASQFDIRRTAASYDRAYAVALRG